jgi:hypothetical protein
MGALVARVGNNPPFLVGAGQVSTRQGQAGLLSLAINDDLPGLHGASLTDNSGFVTAIVTLTTP